MATSLATTEYFMETLLASSPWNVDPNVVPIPWRKELASPPANRKLKLGVVFDDGVVKPQPPVARAMRETVDALRAAGHEGMYTFLPSFPPWVEKIYILTYQSN
jgi:amidase